MEENNCDVSKNSVCVIEENQITTIALDTKQDCDENSTNSAILFNDDNNSNSKSTENTSITNISNLPNDENYILRLSFKDESTFNELHSIISTCIRDTLFSLQKSVVVSVEKKENAISFVEIAGDDNIFMIDTLPTEKTNEKEVPNYKSEFDNVLDDTNENIAETKENDEKPKGNCWNCGGDHSLRDCKEVRDINQINKSKQAFMKTKSERYHLDVDQKFSHLVPGRISEELREALGLRKRELPQYIYRMRIYGYPPGWLEDAKVLHSGLTLFNSDVSFFSLNQGV